MLKKKRKKKGILYLWPFYHVVSNVLQHTVEVYFKTTYISMESRGSIILEPVSGADVPGQGPHVALCCLVAHPVPCSLKHQSNNVVLARQGLWVFAGTASWMKDWCFSKYQNSALNPNDHFFSWSSYIAEKTVFDTITSFILSSFQDQNQYICFHLLYLPL